MVGMSKVSKYADFIESEPSLKPGKKAPYLEDSFVSIKCPHCKVVFVELTQRSITSSKASQCLQHLRICADYKEEVPRKRSSMVLGYGLNCPTAMITFPSKQDEFEQLKAQVERQQEEIKGLQAKTGLYDSVLTAVLPSLQLPLTAPFENAQQTLRRAMIVEIGSNVSPLALVYPDDAVPKNVHTSMIAAKEMEIRAKEEVVRAKEENLRVKDEKLDLYKVQLDAKNTELVKAMREKVTAEREKNEADQRAQEANKTATSASTRAEKLLKERDVLKSRFDAELRAKEQLLKMHGKHGKSLLVQHQQGYKRAMEGLRIEAETRAAAAVEREYAAKQARF